MKKNILALTILVLAATLSVGCQTMNETKQITDKNAATLQEIKQQNSSLEPVLGDISQDVKAINQNYTRQMDVCFAQIKEITAENIELRKDFKELTAVLSKSNKAQTKDQQVVAKPVADNTRTHDGKLILGEAEWIFIAEADASFDSRLDTGASVSSINAVDIEQFERDGKKWYRFNIPLRNSEKIPMEAPWVRNTAIKQAVADGSTEERPVVKLTVKVGNLTGVAEFSLRDRSSMQYSLLIGREFIKDIAVIDVSRNHIQKKIEGTRSVGAYKLNKKGEKIPDSQDIKVKDTKKEDSIPAKPKKDPITDISKQTNESSKTAKPKA